MAIVLGFGLLLTGCLWLLSAQPVHSRGDTFLQAPTPGNELEEQENLPDEILEINRGLILPEAPESSFLLEGDILKVSPFRPFSSANLRWPKKKGVVQIPYILSYKYDQLSLRMIREAFEDFAKFTCVRFVPYSHQRDFISIVPLSGCFSSAGRIGGVQVVSLAPACLRRGKGAALHELMHVLGFWHEHSRADRDKYISIAWNEILTGFEINFIKSWNINMLGAYDYSSVMHYGRNAFSLTGSPTIIPLAHPSTFLGQRWNLSNSDIARINKLYKCSRSASQPEVATGDLIKEKAMGFIPSAPESWAAENNSTRGPNSTAFNRGTTEPIVTPPKILGLNSTAKPHDQSHSVPGESLGTAEASRGFLTATEQVLDTTQVGWTETKMQAGALANASALQTPVAGWQLPTHLPSSSKAPTPSEERASTASKGEHLFSSPKKGSALPLEETDRRTTNHLGKDGASVELSGTKAAYLEPTAVELTSIAFMGSGKRASSSTEGYQEAVAENQPNEGVFHQPVSSMPINETGGPPDTHPGEDAWNKVTHSSYRSSPRSNPTTGVVETQDTEGLANVATTPVQSRLVGKEPGSLDLEKGTGSTYSWLSTSRRPYAANHLGESLPPNKETSVPGIPEAQTNSFDWATPGVPSSLRRRLTGYPSALGPPFSSSAGYSRTEEPTPLVGKGYRWSTSVTHKPPRSFSLHELLKEAGQQDVNFTELPSQTPTWGALTSLAMETNQRGQPTDQTSLPLSQSPSSARLGSKVEVFSSGVITVGGSPPADRQRRKFEQTTETASIATTERPYMTQKIDVVHERGHGRTTQGGQFPTVSSGSQVSPQLERGTEQTQPDSTFLILTGTGRSEIPTGRSNGRRTMETPKQCGGSLTTSEPETIAFPTEHTHKRMTSLYRPLSLGMTRNESPRPITQEYGSSSRRISQPGKERSTSPWWERGSRTPKGSHGTHKETSTAMNKVMQTMTKTKAPESDGVSRTRTSGPTVGPSSTFTILAQSKSTWKRIQSSFSLGRTELARDAESLSTQLLEQVTGVKVSSRKTIPSAEGRSVEPTNPTVDFTTEGMSRVTVPVQEGTIPTSTEGTALFAAAGSFLAPKLVNRVGGTHYIPRTETSSLPREIFPHGPRVASTLFPSSAITQGSRENQTIVLTDAKEVTGSTPKESGVGQTESQVSTLVSAGIHWIPHVGISTAGSPEGHTELPQSHSELQTGVEHGEVPFQENLTKQRDLRASEEPLFATHAGIEPQGAKQSHIGMPVATSLRMKSSSPLTSTYSTKEAREPTLFWRKENTVVSIARPSNKGYSVALLPFRSGTETLKMTPTVSDAHKVHGAGKTEIADVHQVGREYPKEVSARTLQVHLQTPGSVEMEKESYRTSRTGPLEEATKAPTRMGKREQFSLPTESPRPALETPMTVKLVDLAGRHRMGKKVGNKRAFLASSLPTFLHPINKRSLPRTSAKRPSLIMPSPDPDCNLLTSNIGDLNPRKRNIMSLIPKERDVKFIMASLGGTTQQLPPPGCPPLHFNHFNIGQESVALPVENTTAVVPRNPQVMSTSGPKPLPHFQWLPPPAKKVRNNRRPRISNRPAMTCSFKENFCGWTQSQDDSLDWFLAEEEAQPTSSVAESSISGKAFRTLDGYISLKPSSHHPNQKAVLISPIIRGITCLKFWYRPMDSVTGKINFYVKPLHTAEWQKVWSVKGNPDTSWHRVTIDTSRFWPLQVALEGITGAKVGHEAEIDDLVLCRSPCVQC